MDLGAQAKIRKLNFCLRRSRQDSKDQFLGLELRNVKSCSSELQHLSFTLQLSIQKIHLPVLAETKIAEI